MENRNEAEIFINGRRYKISGSESPAYMQKAADYINEVYSELKKIPGFTRKSQDYQTLMMYLNLADKYMKANGFDEAKQAEQERQEAEAISNLKMDLLAARKEVDAAAARLLELKKEHAQELENLQSEHGALKVKYSRMQDQNRVAQEKAAALEKESDAYKTEISILRRNASEIEKQLEEKTAEILRLKDADAALAEKDAEISRLRGLDAALAARDEEIKRLKGLEAVLAEKDAEIQSLKESACAVNSAAGSEELEEKLRQLQEKHEEELVEQRAEFENRYKAKIKALQAELEESTARADEMDSDMIEYLNLIEEKEREIAKLKFKLAEDQYDEI